MLTCTISVFAIVILIWLPPPAVCRSISREHAGTALDDVQAALTEVNGIELPKQNNATFEAITQQFLQTWLDLGFRLHLCAGTPLCLDAPVAEPATVLAGLGTAGPSSIINLMVQRPGGSTLPNITLTLDDLPPRADATCTGVQLSSLSSSLACTATKRQTDQRPRVLCKIMCKHVPGAS